MYSRAEIKLTIKTPTAACPGGWPSDSTDEGLEETS